MNIAIIDDRPEEVKEVVTLLKQYAALNQIELEIDRFTAAESFLKSFRPLLFTAIFMDIYMAGLSGIEAAQLIRESDSSVALIFLTTSEEHRAEAFRYHAYDYLTKPVQKESLFRTMDDLLRIKTEAEEQRFPFSSNRREYSLPYSQIVCIRTESNGSNYLEIVSSSGKRYRPRMTFSSVSQQLLEDQRFVLLQACVLVNLEHIALLKENCVVLADGQELPFSGRKAKEVRRVWQNYMFDKIRDKSYRR